MPRSRFDYTQTCIGDCGHVAEAWPLIGTYKDGKAQDVVFCRTCTVEKYGLGAEREAELAVYVRVVEKKPRGPVEKALVPDRPAVKPRKAAAKKTVAKKPNPWSSLVTTQDISDVSGNT